MTAARRTVKPLDVDLAGIAIIDGLEAAERSMYGDSAKLRAVIGSISAAYLGPTYWCDDRHSYLGALSDLTQRAEAGAYYLLHLECHGCRNGLQIGSDVVPWIEQVQPLAALNASMHGKLVINLSACNGIHASKMAGIDPDAPPFYAVIGPAKKIAMDCVAIVTAVFYREYLGPSFGVLDKSIAQANARLHMDVLKGIRAEAFITEWQAGHPFRPHARDDEIVECQRDGTLQVRKGTQSLRTDSPADLWQ